MPFQLNKFTLEKNFPYQELLQLLVYNRVWIISLEQILMVTNSFLQKMNYVRGYDNGVHSELF